MADTPVHALTLFDVEQAAPVAAKPLREVIEDANALPDPEVMERAIEWAADDPDGPLPDWVVRCLAIAAVTPQWHMDEYETPAQHHARMDQLGLDVFTGEDEVA